jgi:H+/Cl- antiporter ClcA
MPDWLLDRTTVIGLAIVGGAFSILASWCQSREKPARFAKRLNKVAYLFMAASIILFIVAGMFGTEK